MAFVVLLPTGVIQLFESARCIIVRSFSNPENLDAVSNGYQVRETLKEFEPRFGTTSNIWTPLASVGNGAGEHFHVGAGETSFQVLVTWHIAGKNHAIGLFDAARQGFLRRAGVECAHNNSNQEHTHRVFHFPAHCMITWVA